MYVKTTTRIEVTDNVGEHLVTIERTERISIGDSKTRFISGVMEKVKDNAEHAVVTAALGLDRKAASTPEGTTP